MSRRLMKKGERLSFGSKETGPRPRGMEAGAGPQEEEEPYGFMAL